ncbi:hypothetical protein IU470_25785 [Nocardia abscessus]|uniref:Aminoglycoside phosphotransferase domain-containing protein n=1 Tax=Nocardia abscessus TaxID=120957 RepID=A0ABS0CDS5_9NOCA|nr:hypothetical protein [Nocardia abscessus]
MARFDTAFRVFSRAGPGTESVDDRGRRDSGADVPAYRRAAARAVHRQSSDRSPGRYRAQTAHGGAHRGSSTTSGPPRPSDRPPHPNRWVDSYGSTTRHRSDCLGNGHRSGVARPIRPGSGLCRGRAPVFGSGDGNLANYLWDGSDVRVVDFEDSGRSDRAFELAEITEHVGSWVEHPLDVARFIESCELTAAESIRLRDCRRLLALAWLFLLALDDKNRRNPPGTVERQAERVMNLFR